MSSLDADGPLRPLHRGTPYLGSAVNQVGREAEPGAWPGDMSGRGLLRVNLCHFPYLHRLPLLDALRTGEVTRRRRFYEYTPLRGILLPM